MANLDTLVFTGKKAVPQPFDATISIVPVDVDFPTTAPASGDLFRLIKIPPGVQLVDYDLVFPQIDSNGSPALVVSIGEVNAGATDLGTVYEAGLTPGRTASGNVVRCGNAAAAQAAKTAERALALKVTTIAATWAGSTKTGQVLLHFRN
jgi:hypothetical protein